MSDCVGGQAPYSQPFAHSDSTTTVVFFLGGCTYTEIAAIRWMGRQTKGMCLCNSDVSSPLLKSFLFLGRKFLIATTGIINGNTLINAFK